jgi:hypothetical protein
MTTVAELIEQLSKLNQSAKVQVDWLDDLFLIEHEGVYLLDCVDSEAFRLKSAKLIHQF